MPLKSSYQILIAGAGVTGLSCAFHLKKQGIKNIAVAGESRPVYAAETSAGLACGGQLDNFTRVSHAHGEAFAGELWRLGDAGFSSLVSFCKSHTVNIATGERVRLIVSEPEQVEAEKAVAGLRQVNPKARLISPHQGRWQGAFTDRVLSVQEEGETGAVLSHAGLLAALAAQADVDTVADLTHVETSAQGVIAQTSDGREIKAELIVFCSHLLLKQFVPTLTEALVSVADQWGRAGLTHAPRVLRPGTFWTAAHTYEWGGVGKDSLIVGGGRYLRPMAGIEAEAASYEEKIASHLSGQIGKTFVGWSGATITEGAAGLDCRPCDELPIIGPMFGDPRILMATGFMGNGLSMGFQAGLCLAELIAKGKSETLPRRLWPERLRSMESKA